MKLAWAQVLLLQRTHARRFECAGASCPFASVVLLVCVCVCVCWDLVGRGARGAGCERLFVG